MISNKNYNKAKIELNPETYKYEINTLDFKEIDNSKSLLHLIANKFKISEPINFKWEELLEVILKRGKTLKNLIIYEYRIATETHPNEVAQFNKFVRDYGRYHKFNYRIITDSFSTNIEFQVKSAHLGLIFDPKPFNFGLRGDPYLWEDLKKNFENEEHSITEERFVEKLLTRIESHIESGKVHDWIVVVEKYMHGGMSSGGISLNFWNYTAIPLLICRYRQIRLKFG